MKKLYPLIFIFLTAFFVFSVRMTDAVIYHPDFARDVYEILKIIQGDFTLLGPKLTFGGLYTAPYYYYFFALPFLVSGLEFISLHFFNAFVFSLAVSYFFKKMSEKYSLWKSFAAGLAFILLPLYIFSARNPANTTSFISLLFFFLTYLYFHSFDKPRTLFLLGFLYGVIINFDFIVLLPFLPVLILTMYKLRSKKTILFFIFGVFFSFLPLLIFEIKNNFVIFKNTFIHKSYLSWIENKNMGSAPVKKNVIENLFFMAKGSAYWLVVNPLISLGVVFSICIFDKTKKQEIVAVICAVLALLLLAILIRFQFAFHYVFPTAFFVFFVCVVVIARGRFFFLVVLFVFFELVFFNKGLYSAPWRRPEQFERVVKYVIEKKLVEKDSRFNIIQITDPRFMATVGFEYRYFFQKYGYAPQSEFAYSLSDVLFIFSDGQGGNPLSFSSWEVREFGEQYVRKAKKYTVGKISLYKAVRE